MTDDGVVDAPARLQSAGRHAHVCAKQLQGAARAVVRHDGAETALKRARARAVSLGRIDGGRTPPQCAFQQ
jgi:hypothetical protein